MCISLLMDNYNHTLEYLEKEKWKEPNELDSYLIRTCYTLRHKPLKDFTIEDLRIMINQNIGLKYLVPLALKHLEQNILAEGDFYEGDLLKAVSSIDKGFWIGETVLYNQFTKLVIQNESILKERKLLKE